MQTSAKIRVSMADVDTDSLLSQYIIGAREIARNPIQRHGQKSTETDCQKLDGMLWNS